MKSHAQAVVIGGGLIGCSILYHLTKLGWKDVVLLERDELTSGSTWHAAAGLHGLHDNNNISKLQYYTLNLYKELEKETGQSCGIFQPGTLYLAQSEDREHQLRLQEKKAKSFGVDFHEISRGEAEKLHPLVNYDGIRCIMFEGDGGNVDPSGVTQAYASGARSMGAEIHRFTPVTATHQSSKGKWIVETPKGNIETDWVVNAGGLWAREIASLAGFELPLQPTEHQYFVTETIDEIKNIGRRLPSIADRDGEYYLRQEGQGLLIGAYERDMRFWAEEGTPQDFGHELFSDDLERIMENVIRATERIPVAAAAGVKRVINGPMIWSPDSSALFGPVPELKNYFCCCGIIPGFSQSGGLGLMSAQWMINGEAEYDMFHWDLARYGSWATKEFTKQRVKDQYGNRFKIQMPYEEREAGRPLKRRPVYQKQKELGAVFGLSYGWEHPLWFAPKGAEAKEEYGYTRQKWWHHIKSECESLRSNVGIIDISNFAKYEVKGKGAAEWIDNLIANNVPTEVGKCCLTPLIGIRGGIAGDFTVSKVEDDNFLIIGSGMAERYHARFFNMVPRSSSVGFNSVSETMGGFNIAGPKARQLLSRVTQEDLSAEGWKFMRSKKINIAGITVIAIRISFTGDLGWEIYTAISEQKRLYEVLLEAGEDLGVTPVGSRSLLSLRVEKGYGSWGREYSPEYWPQEVGLDRLIKLEKSNFLGKDAYIKIKDESPREKLVVLEVETIYDADPVGGEPVFLLDDTPVGRVTSGAFSYSCNKSLALCMIKSQFAVAGTQFNVAVIGKSHRGIMLKEAPFDPKGDRLRG